MLVMKDKELIAKGNGYAGLVLTVRISRKVLGKNNIAEIGFKYQMTDIARVMGLCGLAGLFENFKTSPKSSLRLP